MLSTVGKRYLLETRFLNESIDVAGKAVFLGPYKAHGYNSRILTPESLGLFADRKLGDGTPMLREQKNRNPEVYCFTWGVSRSVTAKLLTEMRGLSPEKAKALYQDAAACVGVAASKTFNELLKEVMVGRGAQRKIVEPAERLGALIIHGHNQHGEAHLHTHLLMHNGGFLASQGRCYSSKDYRDIFRLQTACTERFQHHLAQALKVRLGWETKIDRDGHCQVTGYDQRVYEKMCGQGRERIEQYLQDNNVPSTDVSRQYAALNVRIKSQEQPSYPLSESIARWQSQAQEITRAPSLVEEDSKSQRSPAQPKAIELEQEPKPQGLQGPQSIQRRRPSTAWSLTRGGFRAVREGFKVRFENGKAVVRVHDVSRFLIDAKKTPRMEAHRAALKAMRKHHWAKSPLETLEVGEKAFKEARKPKVELKHGDRVALSKQALEGLTPAQRKELHRLTKQHDLKINLPELRAPKPQRRPRPENSQSPSL